MTNDPDVPSIKTHPLRRQDVRYRVSAQAQLLSDGASHAIALSDISAKGARIIGTRRMHDGQDVSLLLKPPFVHDSLENRGKVSWSKPLNDGRYEMGLSLSFIDMRNIAPASIIRESGFEFTAMPPIQAMPLPNAVNDAQSESAPVRARQSKHIKRAIAVILAVAAIIVYRGQLSVPLNAIKPALNKVPLLLKQFKPFPAFRVDGFMYDPNGQSVVYIDGGVAKEGDIVHGYKIEKIRQNSITLRAGRRTKEILLNTRE